MRDFQGPHPPVPLAIRLEHKGKSGPSDTGFVALVEPLSRIRVSAANNDHDSDHFRNAPTKLMKELGYGEGEYGTCLPESLGDLNFFEGPPPQHLK